MQARNETAAGFTLIELMIVVAVIGLLAAIATPMWVHARTHSQKNACISNLSQIEGATQQWALENKKPGDALVTYDDISGYLKRDVTCPAAASGATFGSSYQLNGVSSAPSCLISPVDHKLTSTSAGGPGPLQPN